MPSNYYNYNLNPSGTIVPEYLIYWWLSKDNIRASRVPSEPEIKLFQKTSLSQIKRELEDEGELGSSTIAGIVKGLHESHAYRHHRSDTR